MFKKKENDAPDTFDTLIGSKTSMSGDIECEGTIRVDGIVKGDLKIKGDAFIGNNGVITGNISAINVVLSGVVEGNIHASGVLRILSTAKLYGDIQVQSFVADEGALFQGKCSMVDASPSDKSDKKSNPKKANFSKEYKKSPVIDQDSSKETTENE